MVHVRVALAEDQLVVDGEEQDVASLECDLVGGDLPLDTGPRLVLVERHQAGFGSAVVPGMVGMVSPLSVSASMRISRLVASVRTSRTWFLPVPLSPSQ